LTERKTWPIQEKGGASMNKVIEILRGFTNGTYNTEGLNLEEQLEWKAKLIVEALFPKGDSEGLLKDEELKAKYKELWLEWFNTKDTTIDEDNDLLEVIKGLLKLQQALDKQKEQERKRIMLMKLDRCTSYPEMNEVLKELMEGL
jgi:hypothetical protein